MTSLWLRLGVAASVCCAAGSGLAQSLPFPASPTTAAAAAAEFDTRASAVIAVNACSREDDYLRIRGEMAAGNFDHQGEDLAHILVAKIAFIRAGNPMLFSPACSGLMFRHRSLNPDASLTLEQFEAADRLLRAAGPTACAEETAHFLQRERQENGQVVVPEGVLVQVRVTRECMSRQVNEAIMAMRKTTQLGSSGVPCLATLSLGSEGEFDVNVRELVRVLNLSNPIGQRAGGLLAPSTIDHMYAQLLAARGKLSDASYSTIIGCSEPAGDELGSPEDTADRHAWYRDVADFLGDLFEWAVITYITYGLFPGAGALIAAPFLLSAAGGDPSDIVLSHWDVRVPESENHRLMIESSRYLTNADIVARLTAKGYEGADQVIGDQGEVRDWLMRRLQDIAAHDFTEYNSRPYSRYSLNAVLNLHDFAAAHNDPDLALAARIVLDLSAAKFAATSNRGRRIVPFRRLSDADGDEGAYLHESVSGADHEVPRSMLLTGQIQTVDRNRERELLVGALSEMVNAATSPYRLPAPVLATAVERRSFEQTIRHAAVERVEQSPAFTISAGGVASEPTGMILGLGRDKDRGVAMPTVIIPTLAGGYLRDLFRFDGTGVHHERSANTCVAPGFACGIGPRLSVAFSNCTKAEVSVQDSYFFVSSAVCFPASPGPHFYLAARIGECSGSFCANGHQWGVMDIAEAAALPANNVDAHKDPPYLLFQAQRRAALVAATPDAAGQGRYLSAGGRRITYLVTEGISGAGDRPSVLTIDGAPAPAWITTGGAIDADGLGRATISGPGGPVTIDFSNALQPKRTP